MVTSRAETGRPRSRRARAQRAVTDTEADGWDGGYGAEPEDDDLADGARFADFGIHAD